MADIASLVSKAVTGAAVASTVGGLIDTYKKAVPKIPDPNASIKAAAAVATPTDQQLSITSVQEQRSIAEVVEKSRQEIQNLNVIAYPRDPAPFEVRFNFIAFKQGGEKIEGSGRNLISKSLSEIQTSSEVVKLFNTTISLPLPGNLVENLAIQYEQLDQGAFGGQLTDALISELTTAQSSIQRGGGVTDATFNSIQSLAQSGFGFVKDALTNPAIFEAAIRATASGVVGGVTGQVRGTIINPQRTLQFNGVELRAYEYSWRFLPNSPVESEDVKKIIRTFQVKSLPDKTDRYFLKYPDLVQVKFARLEDELYEHKLCFIEAVNVNYAPSGQPSFFAGTDSPIEIEMTVKLRETSIRTRDDYEFIFGGEDR